MLSHFHIIETKQTWKGGETVEDKWFVILRDSMSIAGNLAECIGVVFLFTSFRRSARNTVSTVKRRTYSTTTDQ